MFDDPILPVRPVRPIRAVRAIGLRRRPSGEQLGLARWFARRCAAKSRPQPTAEEAQTLDRPLGPDGRGVVV